jgi:hypothetical protein
MRVTLADLSEAALRRNTTAQSFERGEQYCSKLPPPEAVAFGEMHLEGALIPPYSSSNNRC